MKRLDLRYLDVGIGILLIIGGLNWGLVGFFNWNLVGAIFGPMTFISRLIYALVGIGAVYEVLTWKYLLRRWHCTARFGEPVSVEH